MSHAPEPLDSCIEFQLLSSRITARLEDPNLLGWLAYLSVDAKQAIEICRTLTYRISGHGPWTIYEGSDFLARGRTPEDVLYLLYGRAYQRVLEPYAQSGWVMLHAALVDVDGRRLVLMGDKGTGKTTLASRLMLAGHKVQGDEMTLVREKVSLAVPRRFHLKPGAHKWLPELAEHISRLPITHADDMVIRAMDPKKAGFSWNIHSAPVDALVWLTPNHGAGSELAAMGSLDTLRKLLESHLHQGETRQKAMDTLVPLASGGGYDLQVGQTVETVAALEKLADELN